MHPPKTDYLIDPAKYLSLNRSAPYTWVLNLNLEIYLKALETDKQYDSEYDNICAPGHKLIDDTFGALLFWGSPGVNAEEIPENLVDVLMRGATSPDIFAALLPSLGKYILYLWLVRTLIQTGMNEWPSERMPFKYEYNDDGLQGHPTIDCPEIGLEWFWIGQFLNLSSTLNIPDLDLIPAFWYGSKENTMDYPRWKEMRLELQTMRPHLAYVFRHVEVGSRAGKILAIPQNKDLYSVMIMMTGLEISIHGFLKGMIQPEWEKMRSQGELNQDQIDKNLRTRFNWQINEWPEPFLEDHELSTTAQRSTYIGNHKDRDQVKWMDKTHKTIKKLFKRSDGVMQGKGRTKNKLDLKDEDLIMALGPDLDKALEFAWPIEKKVVTSRGELKMQIKKLTFEKLRAQHFEFRWSEIKPNDRLDFLSKIVRQYLLDITGNKYNLRVLRAPIREILP